MKRAVCPVCNHEITANTDQELVTKVQQHANQVHNMDMTTDQARQLVMQQQQQQQAGPTGRMGQSQGTGKGGKTGR